MAGAIYAFLVGIDDYPSPAHRLSGCANDVRAFREFLEARVPSNRLHLKVLLNDEATRARVIDAFRHDLGKATATDTALFYFAGHGSRERAPEEFWTIEPDRLDETLVLWDSRQPDGWDLADKELAALIRPVAKSGAHVLVILDSCHSGSGTRAASSSQTRRVRRFPVDARDRPLDSFLPEVQAIAAARSSESGWDLGDDGRHVLLAACRDDQEAAEHDGSGTDRGAFSWHLTETLSQAPGTLTYRDLAGVVRARVVTNIPDQEPQVEATSDADLDRSFLDGVVQPRTKAFFASEIDGDWWMDGGTIHGVPSPRNGESARVALFDALATTTLKVSDATAVASVVEVQPARARLSVERGELAAGTNWKAVLISTPLASHTVRLEGDAARVAQVQAAMAKSVYVAETRAGSDFVLDCGDGRYEVRHGVSGTELVAPAATPEEAVNTLEHIAQWRHLRDLENPISAIDPAEFDVKVFADQIGTRELEGTDLRLPATRNDKGAIVSPKFRVRFANRGNRDLYFGMLALDELYACDPSLVKGGVLKLQPGDAEGWALDGKALKSAIPNVLRAEGRTQSQDILKIIVSTAPFNVGHAGLTSLGVPRKRAAGTTIQNSLDRLLARTGTRTISADDDNDEIRDFQTRTLIITTVEPAAGVAMTAAAPADVGHGVVLAPHPALSGRARLTTMLETRSDVGAAILPPLFRSDSGGETIAFSKSRGSSPTLSVLELSGVVDHTVVTPDVPLKVTLPDPVAEGDVVLPVAFDGEDYLILGSGALKDGSTQVTISRLPYPVSQRNRSLGGSIKILFQKLASPLLGTKYEYPLLAEAGWDATGKVAYETDKDRIRARVAAAKRVVVFVHGIIGDTRAMGAKLKQSSDDVFLTFDYENLHTTIEANAEGLRDHLNRCGLGKGHGKEVILVAHSMGGLVSRWFTEKLGGREMVSRVILCGTPNAGSNWSSIEDWLTGAASLALNGLTKISWEAAAIGYLFKGLEKIDNSLDQMKPSSAFLTELGTLDDPGIPYVVLAGNTSLAAAADAPRVQRLLKKLLHKTTSIAFLFEPNDVAVSVKSIGSVGATWNARPDTREVACDHLTYFSHPAGLTELKALIES